MIPIGSDDGGDGNDDDGGNSDRGGGGSGRAGGDVIVMEKLVVKAVRC